MRRDGVVQISVVSTQTEVLLCIAHLEEVPVLTTSEWIVSVLALVAASVAQWLLDVPEGVAWDGFQDLSLDWRAQALAVSFLEIFDEVVFLARLEDTELFIED